jgi:hypothetical protein
MSLAPPPTKRRRAGGGTTIVSTSTLLLEQQLESLQAELDHERSLRILDQRRAQQQQERLDQQVTFAVDEANSAKSLLDQWQLESHQLTTKLRQARDGALTQVRELQMQLNERDEDDDYEEDDSTQYWKSECHRLQTIVDAQASREEGLYNEMEDVREEARRQADASALREQQASSSSSPPAVVVEDAQPALLKELQRLRIQLAESERQQRQFQRSLQAAERRHLSLVRERERVLRDAERVPALQQALDQLQKEHETAVAQHQSWNDFGKRLGDQLRALKKTIRLPEDSGGPPEPSTVLRALETARAQIEQANQQLEACRKEMEDLKTTLQSQERNQKEFQEKERQWSTERDEFQQKLEMNLLEEETIRGQCAIYKREAESLRSLLQTFEDLPLGSSKASGGNSALQVTLSSTQKELELILKDRDRLAQQLQAATQAHQEQRQELDRIREKFFKLRDALQDEKTKVERAETRANQAEALAGKGSFDPERTRVLHFEETPLMQALKEEIGVLKRRIEATTGAGGDKSFTAHDPEKLNQRLKQNFKEQIALFREGVYLMTGYKVDMLPAGPGDRPTFRVRSMYAEREEDHLLLKWPKDHSQVSSLDILMTDQAKLLASTPSYDYMAKFQSLPAFLSSVQLSLFEKQTVMM